MNRWHRSVLLALLWTASWGCTPPPKAPPAAPSPAATASATLATAPDQFLAVGDLQLRYREIGQGEPVVLLHHLGGRLESWNREADSLASDYRVIALDLRGFGQSSRPSDPARYGTEMADDVARLLDHLQIRQAHLVGHSLGALVAANLAQRHPARVQTLTVAGGPFRDSTALAQHLLAPGIRGLEQGEGLRPLLAVVFPTLDDAVLSRINQQLMATNDRDAMLAVLKNYPPAMTPRQVASLPVPTLAMVGSADPYLDDTQRIADTQGQARVVIVEGANHGDIAGRPEFLRALRAHLAPR